MVQALLKYYWDRISFPRGSVVIILAFLSDFNPVMSASFTDCCGNDPKLLILCKSTSLWKTLARLRKMSSKHSLVFLWLKSSWYVLTYIRFTTVNMKACKKRQKKSSSWGWVTWQKYTLRYFFTIHDMHHGDKSQTN